MKKKILIGALAVGVFVVAAYAAATKFTDVLVTGTLQVNGITTLGAGLKLPVVDVAVSTPSAAGLLVRNSSSVVYISTGATSPSQWSKVGAQ